MFTEPVATLLSLGHQRQAWELWGPSQSFRTLTLQEVAGVWKQILSFSVLPFFFAHQPLPRPPQLKLAFSSRVASEQLQSENVLENSKSKQSDNIHIIFFFKVVCHYNYSTAVDSSMVLIYKLEFKHRKKFQCMWDSGPPGTLSFYWGLFLQYGGAIGLALSSANLSAGRSLQSH